MACGQGNYKNKVPAQSGSQGQHQILVTPCSRVSPCIRTCEANKENTVGPYEMCKSPPRNRRLPPMSGGTLRILGILPIHWEIFDRSLRAKQQLIRIDCCLGSVRGSILSLTAGYCISKSTGKNWSTNFCHPSITLYNFCISIFPSTCLQL